MRSVGVAEARQEFTSLIGGRGRTMVLRHGEEVACIVSAREGRLLELIERRGLLRELLKKLDDVAKLGLGTTHSKG